MALLTSGSAKVSDHETGRGGLRRGGSERHVQTDVAAEP